MERFKTDEERVSDLYKLALETLPVETRVELLVELQRIIAVLPDPEDVVTLMFTVNNVKATLN